MTVLPEEPAERLGLRAALRLLLGPYESAELLGCPARELAVGLKQLRATGLDAAALKRLVVEGYVEEVGGPRAGRHFALTATGASLAREDDGRAPPPREKSGTAEGAPADVPHWVEGRRRLTYRRHLVKQFARKAPRQFRVLKAFQDRHWAAVIDNPFGNDRTARRLLGNAVKGLNRRLKSNSLRFEVEDEGKRVRWVAVRSGGGRGG